MDCSKAGFADESNSNAEHTFSENASSVSRGSETGASSLTAVSCSSTAGGRNPNCSLCKNHGILRKLKGHKRRCPRRDCPCPLCVATRSKRAINAAQVAIRRAQMTDAERPDELPADCETNAESTSSSNGVPDRQQGFTPSSAAPPPAPQHLHSTWLGPGPIAFGQQISRAVALLGQSVMCLHESLRDPHLRISLLPHVASLLQQEIVDTERIAKEIVSKLDDAGTELSGYYTVLEAPHRRMNSSLSTSREVPRNGDASFTPMTVFQYPSSYPLFERTSVITSVRTSFVDSLTASRGFCPYGTLHSTVSRRDAS